jgi:LPS sulfotransferase NodH
VGRLALRGLSRPRGPGGHVGARHLRGGEPAFDFEQIDGLYHVARIHDAAWSRWFASQSLEPFEIVYEELVLEPDRVARHALTHLGHEGEAALQPPQSMQRQADAVNEEWIARYSGLADL